MALVVLVLSPLLLAVVVDLLPYRDARWSLLSDAGQSFGGVAAIVSAAALLGVVYSVRAQARQTLEQRIDAVSNQQRELIFKGMEQRHLLEIFGPVDDSAESLRRAEKDSYRNLWFIYLYSAYRLGEVSEESIRRAMRDEFFADDEGVAFWRDARRAWDATATGRLGDKFLAAVDDEHRRASTMSTRDPGPVSGEREPRREAD